MTAEVASARHTHASTPYTGGYTLNTITHDANRPVKVNAIGTELELVDGRSRDGKQLDLALPEGKDADAECAQLILPPLKNPSDLLELKVVAAADGLFSRHCRTDRAPTSCSDSSASAAC